MTLDEIFDTVDAFKRKKEYTEKIEAERLFVLAEAISTRVAFFLSAEKGRKEDMILMPWDAYPTMFEKEQKMVEEQKTLNNLEERRKRQRDYAKAKKHTVVEGTQNGNTT